MTRWIPLFAALGFVACLRASPPSPVNPIIPAIDAGQDAGNAIADAGPDVVAPKPSLKYKGVNLSGGEFAPSKSPRVYDKDYKYPDAAAVEFFAAKGMNTFRIPFLHEQLQPELQKPLNEDEFKRLDTLVQAVVSRGHIAIIEPHNFARHKGTVLTQTQMGDLWGRLAGRYKNSFNVWFNLTNEPNKLPTETWAALANAGLKEIRRVGASNHVHVPGSAWTGGGHWCEKFDGYTPNSIAMLAVKDPGENMSFEMHQYLDKEADGSGECVSPSIGVERLTCATAWLREHKAKGFLGEIAVPNTALCREALTRTLAFLEQNADVWVGWAWWGAGAWSFSTTYPLSIGPSTPEKPQLSWLEPFLTPPK